MNADHGVQEARQAYRAREWPSFLDGTDHGTGEQIRTRQHKHCLARSCREHWLTTTRRLCSRRVAPAIGWWKILQSVTILSAELKPFLSAAPHEPGHSIFTPAERSRNSATQLLVS